MGYTTDGIMAQVYVAFGQGTGAVRVSQEACLALEQRYRRHVTNRLVEAWDDVAVPALERVRAIGRAAGNRAALDGRTAITIELVQAAIRTLDRDGGCPWCPARATDGEERREPAGTTREGIVAQVYVAFGQGTGAVRVSQEACLSLRDRYQARIDGAILNSWPEIAVQVLERIRAMGRMVAAEAALSGATVIGRDRLLTAMPTVERVSATPICPQSHPGADHIDPAGAARPLMA